MATILRGRISLQLKISASYLAILLVVMVLYSTFPKESDTMAREMPVMSTLDRACPTFSSVSSSSPDTALC